ncbi:MAG: PAS domain S-box protein [Thermoflexales bacterium]|nr:PAS domain S-box protein [Thermoflexales bacterium]
MWGGGGDITDRKQIESQLQISLTKYQTLFETLPVGITIADRSGQITESNQAASSILGLTKEAHTRRQIDGDEWRIIRPDGSPMPPDEYASVRALNEQRQVSNVEMGVVKSADQTTWISVTAAPLALEEAGVIIAYMDITERKQAEEALRQSEARWHSIINTSPDGICITTLDGEIQFASNKLLALHGYDQPADMLGRNVFEFVDNAYHEVAIARIQTMLSGIYPGVGEYKVIRRDGSPFYVDINAEVLRDAAGQPANLLLVERDVTARKLAEDALRESERRFRDMMNQVQLCCATLDTQANITFANDYFLKLTDWPRDEVMGRNWFDLFVPAQAAVRQDLYRDLAAGTVPLQYENEILTRHGAHRLVAWSNSVVHDAVGGIAGVSGIGVDITERKHAEAALLRQNQYLAALQETTLELSAQLDLDRLFENIVARAAALVDAAGGFCDMVDPATNQLLPRVGVGVLDQARTLITQPGEGVAGIVWQTGQPLVIQEYDAWANRVGKYERGRLGAIIGVPLLKNQQTLGVLGLAYEFNSGRTFGPDAIEILMQLARLAAIAIDNARLFEAERARHRELEAVYEVSLQVTRSLDMMSVLDTISMATLGLTPAEYVHIFLYDGEHFDAGTAMSKQGRVAPLRQPRQNGLTYTAARTSEAIFVEDTLHHPTYNAVIRQNPPQYAIAALPLMSEATVVGVMNVTYGSVHRFNDEEQRALKLLAAQVASAIKNARLHQQLREHAQQLEQRVAERTADLQAANLRLTELDHLKDEFLSRISHELRTPLTSIKIYLELLENGKPEKREKYLRTLKQEADRLHALIEEVLTFSQLNLKPDRLVPIDLNYLIESHLTTWQRLTASHDLAFHLSLSHEQPMARADAELCFQALNRLLMNAVNYTPAGAVTLSTAPRDDNDQHWVTISVTDTGPGITPDDLPHIFERFYRGRAAANYKTPGTGIGLAICHEIAQKLGGKVTADTQVGVGSTFTLWLPVA